MKTNKYKCAKCKKIIERKSNKKWIRSMCIESGCIMTRLILIKDD